MARKPADLRIIIKRRGGKTHRIELIRQEDGERFWVRRDGKLSESLPEATASQIADRIRGWIVAGEVQDDTQGKRTASIEIGKPR